LNGKFYIGKEEKNNPEYLGSGLLLNKAIKQKINILDLLR